MWAYHLLPVCFYSHLLPVCFYSHLLPVCFYTGSSHIPVYYRADDLSSDFALKGIVCQCIHGGREQIDRETALQEFRDGTVKLLIATDVASRGLDIADIRLADVLLLSEKLTMDYLYFIFQLTDSSAVVAHVLSSYSIIFFLVAKISLII